MNRYDNSSRRVIDLAVGVLIGLRGCDQDTAFAELTAEVQRTGIGVGTVASELVALASGTTDTTHAAELDAWTTLIRQRRLAEQSRPLPQ
ncbi:ANTAR domain-containing protein [Mycobacterium sp.]|uniref:ANTAR domain-containing protein n=1 Tax=Mycobacterium sp. TaxID=1785 RepID=UPI0025FDED20|nr:ANTAR domain-containing protein [Mycobacterium sp.]